MRHHYIWVCHNLSNYCSSYFLLKVFKIITKFCVLFFLFHNIVARVIVCLYSLLLILSGDAEINPGSLSSFQKIFPICHWNVNGISAHDYSKSFLLKAHIILHQFDIICLSETYLDSTISNDDDILQTPGYTLICSDHSSNTKSSLPLRVVTS